MSIKLIPLFVLLVCGDRLLAADPRPVNVSVLPLADLAIRPAHSAPATVVSLNDAVISARINAEIEAVSVQVGDRVEQGQVLVELDCSDSRLDLKMRRADRSLAEKELARIRKLEKTSNVSAQQLNLRATEFTRAQAAQAQAELEVARCRIKAPFAGVITARQAAEGELASPGTPLLRLLDTGRLEISAQVAVGLTASLEQAAGIDYLYEGIRRPVRMRVLLPQVNTTAGNREARLIFTAETALAGSAGRIVWHDPRPHVPADLLIRRSDSVGIFLLENDSARFKALPHAVIGQPAAVDLDMNTQVILDGRYVLQDGDAVVVARP